MMVASIETQMKRILNETLNVYRFEDSFWLMCNTIEALVFFSLYAMKGAMRNAQEKRRKKI